MVNMFMAWLVFWCFVLFLKVFFAAFSPQDSLWLFWKFEVMFWSELGDKINERYRS